MHCDMLKIQDGGAIVEKLNWYNNDVINNFVKATHSSTS